MKLKRAAFWATIVTVVVLLGSAILGLRGGGGGDGPPAERIAARVTGGQRIRVEVLNAAGVAGLARTVTEQLRDQGFDVVYYGNAGALTRDSTTILDRAGNESAIAALQEALELDRVEAAIDTSLYLEATVVLGADWGGR